MIRRQFLAHALRAAVASAAASMGARGAFAQHAGHDMDDMPGMEGMGDMHDMHNMAGMPGMSSPAAQPAASALASPNALPAGAPLAPLRKLANESGDPGTFRATLVAQPVSRQLMPGKQTSFWLYGDAAKGPIIGPLIEVHEEDTVEIRFVNRLPQPSTVHWHGLPVPPDQDGNPSDPVAPGESRVYRFTLPRGSAGTYWYHPHPHTMSAGQVYRGLAGPIIVRAADDPLAAWPERHLFFTDLKLAADGAVAPNDLMDWMNGREGQFVLVNGARQPRIVVARDERWRVWNGCNARYLRLSLGVSYPFAQVGTDGGLLGDARDGLTELLLAPGERAELIVRAGQWPSQTALTAAVYDRRKMAMTTGNMHGSLTPDPARVLADVRFAPAGAAAGAAPTSHALPSPLRPIEALQPPAGVVATQKSVVFSEEMDMAAMHRPDATMSEMPAGMKFMINGATFDASRIALTSRRGDIEHWSIENRTDMDHPFHLHGTQFQIIEREREGKKMPEPFLAWRDTVNVRPGETVRIATVQKMPGERMFHCHILEHEDLGMMATLKVV
ncbi:multicopper oxidase family protein [Paraburkholderia solisilvae]|uniref:Multicopper oxidase mco n=1 Tax=Paraburkholderia solisilvae TaxID=624376 RepID=A0A6J5EH07_9BURK|nr:multicopper oxidase family protein [Paraburkholderia solisilvae]CAB3765828.1 Multicopper oxidase mco [Paraburkholderia solisilvae]